MGETEGEEPEIKWGRFTGHGGKQKKVKFYESFTFDNVEYFKYDCVYLFKEDEPEPYVGKLLKIWEANKQKKGKVLWFFHPDEISNFIGGLEDVVENELFIASGEATGLANINPLEAIAGKCNVVCISKDNKNPQPTDEEVRKADFVFRRTFDVAEFKIKDEIKGEIAGIDVKFLLNRGDSKGGSVSADVCLETKECSENAVQNDLTGPTNGDSNEPEDSDDVVKINGHYTDDTPANEPGSLTATCEKTVSDTGTEPGKEKTISKVESKKRKERAGKVVKGAKDFDKSDEKVSKKAKPASKIMDKGKSVIQDPVLGTEDTTVVETSLPTTSTEIKDKVKSADDSFIKAEGPSKRMKPDKIKTKLHGAMEIKDEIMPVDDSLVKEEGPSKKLKLDKTKAKLSDRKLIKTPSQEGRDEGRKNEGQELQLTINDKSKWFKDLPWEDELRTSHEHGKLVLLQNLDPSCTSAEVKAIIMNGFKVNCKAKMIQRTEFSSPHTGQAFAIFDTREVAEMVIKRLKESCLLLSSGRPLVASPGNPCFPKKKPTFFGHLIIDKIRGTMHRVQKEAVSTSHCSQPNTIEYDMAIEWCLLQARSESELKKLFKVQEGDVRKLVDQLKDREKMKPMLLK